MTPKEKAEDIVRKYSTYVVMWSGGIEVERQNVKQCALICCNEVLGYMGADRGYAFWTEVKKEIENL
jgi:hypothetical protein